MRFSKRRSLLAALLIGELVCLVAGGFWYTRWLDSSLTRLCTQQVLSDNALMAGQLAHLIDDMELDTVEVGSASWIRLQKLIEQTELPNQGFVCIIGNPTGELICHPEMRAKPEMRKMTPGLAAISTASGTEAIVSLIQARGTATGAAKMKDGIHLISARHLPELNMNLMVHQRLAGVQASIDRVVKPVGAIGLVVSLCIVAVTGLASVLIIRRYEDRLARVNDELEETVHGRTRALMKTRNATIFGLAKLADSRDPDTGEHLDRIRGYVELLAGELARHDPGVTQAFIEDLKLASSLHDIGKVGIPDSILLKPGRLTPDERCIMETHATIGGECLAEIELRLGDDDFLDMARDIAFAHHEWWDGSGYRNGLAGTDIPLAARLVAVADVYDALTSKRPYKEPMDHQTAFQLIVQGKGTQFDPAVVRAFIVQQEAFAELSARHHPTTVNQEPPLPRLPGPATEESAPEPVAALV